MNLVEETNNFEGGVDIVEVLNTIIKEVNSNLLVEAVERYGSTKAEMDSYKKLVDEDNKLIKKLMVEKGLTVCEGENFTAKYSVAVSENFDEDKLVSKLQSIWSEHNGSMTNPYLKMVYVPDMDAIENAIYNGQLNAADLADCKVRKETPRLTISKTKKKSEE